MTPSERLHQAFIACVSEGRLPAPSRLDTVLGDDALLGLFQDQTSSRLLDIVSRRMARNRESFYTIGSAGHEGNAAVAAALRIDDPAFLHYRSCAFALARHRQQPVGDAVRDALLAFTASAEDPVSGGRHKVIGSRAHWIPPQTSTIASHLPKAMGTAHALGLYRRVAHRDVGLAADSLAICSFGDASLNHSTTQGALNTAAWAAFQGSPMPLLLVCEDNGIGISTPTPVGWVEASVRARPGIHYISCDGRDLLDTYRAACLARDHVRLHRRPAFLHFRTVRLLGHAGTDAETGYRSAAQIAEDEAQDPLLMTASTLIDRGLMTAAAIVDSYRREEHRIETLAKEVATRPKLTTSADVMASLLPMPHNAPAPPLPDEPLRAALFGRDARQFDRPLSLSRHINLALADLMLQYSDTLVFGEDVAKKGGVYGVTRGLLDKFGPARVTNTLLDEQSILGLAIGLAQCGYLPIAEIQYLAYLHNAEDQLRGEAATLSFFSNRQFSNGMVVRIAGLAYQKGFGGHFHNDNSIAVLRDIPGLVVATPSCGRDAAGLLRTCVDLAHREQRVVVFLEPIALYMTTDLFSPGDNLWAAPYPSPAAQEHIAPGSVHATDGGSALAIVSYANGYYLSTQAAQTLREEDGIDATLVDLRWLQPLPEASLLEALRDCECVLIVDECRRSGSVSEALMTLLQESLPGVRAARITALDSFIPLGDAAYTVLPDREGIVSAARQLLSGSP
ncbi:thiamine pyrophosphate-dependent enzyme [Chromatocurvus halotolerans]|nr:thiamine pyrophosphate-dependent enzyme [Chromatocurvus halotolerans]